MSQLDPFANEPSATTAPLPVNPALASAFPPPSFPTTTTSPKSPSPHAGARIFVQKKGLKAPQTSPSSPPSSLARAKANATQVVAARVSNTVTPKKRQAAQTQTPKTAKKPAIRTGIDAVDRFINGEHPPLPPIRGSTSNGDDSSARQRARNQDEAESDEEEDVVNDVDAFYTDDTGHRQKRSTEELFAYKASKKISKSLEERLDQEQGFHRFAKFSFIPPSGKGVTVRVGDVVQVYGGDEASDEIWAGEVTRILSAAGETSPKKASSTNAFRLLEAPEAFFEVNWLYTKDHLEGVIAKTDWRLVNVDAFGEQEFALTDHADWNRHGNIKKVLTVLQFDDRFPSLAAKAQHPLAFRSPVELRGMDEKLPPFLFGDGYADYHSNDKDSPSFDNAIFIRAELEFQSKATTAIKKSPVRKTKGGKSKFQLTMPRKARAPMLYNTPLTLNTHHFRDAYNPESPQIFSTQVKAWLTIDGLRERGLYTDAHDFVGFKESIAGGVSEDVHVPSLSLSEASARMIQIARAPIVRGGAYGLTGNAWLVEQAKEWKNEWLSGIGAHGLDAGETEDFCEQALDVARAYGQWWKGVELREEKGMDLGLPKKDHSWLTPDKKNWVVTEMVKRKK